MRAKENERSLKWAAMLVDPNWQSKKATKKVTNKNINLFPNLIVCVATREGIQRNSRLCARSCMEANSGCGHSERQRKRESLPGTYLAPFGN